MIRRFRRLRRDEQGANAIEYAIIAALIGIGLIGSLVGTRTSLSSIFGVAGSQMASAGSDSASAGLGPERRESGLSRGHFVNLKVESVKSRN